ncbi:unnamed protein product [Caenorhabditis auriculariae]|uniref:G-protein coupled receptors family 1 profile domain-containing protein n=1 Tax=Caenorhabditis auriculariae TaxID=2777116 RepID=A0A8S1GV47_9PELO|nr:unnamed protein product [Caenorhabditis auriculariae]
MLEIKHAKDRLGHVPCRSVASRGLSRKVFGAIEAEGAPMAQVDYVAHVIVMPIVLSIGMVNQCLNVCTLLQLPTGCFLYLKASAIADIFSIISLVPFLLRHASLIDPRWRFGMLYHAHVELPLINALICCSALNIVAMTVDRYLSVCHPIKFFHASDSRARTICVIFSLYLTAFLIYIPSMWQKKLEHVSHDNLEPTWNVTRNKEVEENFWFQAYLIFREIVSRWGPVIILVILNAAMIRSLRRMEKRQSKWGRSSRTSRTTKLSGRSVRSVREDRGRISALLLVTSTTFVICNLPASFLSLFIKNLVNESMFWQTFRAIANLLQVTSYLYNFYLYALCSSEYREAFLQLVGCKKISSPFSTGDSPTVRLSVNARRGQIQTLVEKGPTHPKAARVASSNI